MTHKNNYDMVYVGDDKMEFKERLKQLRIERDIPVTQLAATLKKTEGAIRMWEIGKSKPDIDSLTQLAQIFDCTSDYLLGLSDFKNAEKQKGFEEGWEKFFWLLSKIPDHTRETVYDICMRLVNLAGPDTPLSSCLIDNISSIVDNIVVASSFIDISEGKPQLEYEDEHGKVIRTNEASQLLFIGVKGDTVEHLSNILDALSKEFNSIYPVDLPDKDNIIKKFVRRIKS